MGTPEDVATEKHFTQRLVDYVACSKCGKRVSNLVGKELVVRAWVECPECLAEAPKPTEYPDLQKKLEIMPLEDLGRTMFWLTGFMSEQSKEHWDKFCEAIKSSPCFPKEEVKW